MKFLHRLLFPAEFKRMETLEEKVKNLETSVVKIVIAVNNVASALEKVSEYIVSQEAEGKVESPRSVFVARQQKKEYIN